MMNQSKVDRAQIDALEQEIKQLTTIRNNLPREKWAYVEQQLALRRDEIAIIKARQEEIRKKSKLAMLKVLLVCDYIIDVAEEFVDNAKLIEYSGKSDAAKLFTDMVRSISDRHNICCREWNEIVCCIDTKNRKTSEQYVDIYDDFLVAANEFVDEFLEKVKKTKFFNSL